uniref:Prolyl endopeptidase n=2 Tax=Eutreptiella gymnastica TaxID=73025 RepID=A0A7S1IYM7_9EUGL|mmetsp:Transcript_53070/g.94737  ORF Transcript_53070/g.94737 Transcript_53070/m.94737 type:complete len:196 (+) Transcript_53070:889-1476(+)
MGRAWYEDEGKYLTKMNTFNDFCDSGDFLVQAGWTKPEMMAIHGRSAGGLLVGAVMNLRPDLCRVALAGVPFVDVMCTMRDASIPLTVQEWVEWGNPNEAKYYDYMNSYSPIDNVVAQAYPALLVTAGLHDPRVAFWEPAKWVATLRARKTDTNTILLKTDMTSGHFSASDRYKYLREKAIEFSFVLDQLGCADP